MNNAQRVVMQLSGEAPNGAPTTPEDRPPPASRLPSWVIRAPLEHMMGGVCWCQPTYEDVPGGGRLFIHRPTIDSPARAALLGAPHDPE